MQRSGVCCSGCDSSGAVVRRPIGRAGGAGRGFQVARLAGCAAVEGSECDGELPSGEAACWA